MPNFGEFTITKVGSLPTETSPDGSVRRGRDTALARRIQGRTGRWAMATIRTAVDRDADRIAQILIDVRSAFMPYAPSAHTADEVRSWVAQSLVPSGRTVVAESNGAVVGAMATEREDSCSWITQMAVDPLHVGNGIGALLLQHAFDICPLPIRLYTFQANLGARRFYERHGFRAVRLGDGATNEERCPDVLYEIDRA